ncbi:MAG: O-antigen ligase family protein [Chloroflexi bacterium]|nr:O-antigen ligase family protein [Chloroflexota bacterium]
MVDLARRHIREARLGVWQPFAGIVVAVLLGYLLWRLPLIWGAALVGGTAVILLIFLYPLLGIGLALLLGPFGALESVVFGNPILDSGQATLVLTILAWMSRLLIRRKLFLRKTFLTLPILLFIAVAAVSLLDTVSLAFGFRELLKWVEIGLIMMIVVDLGVDVGSVDLSKQVKYLFAIFGMLLLTGLVQAGIGIWQFGLRGSGPEHFIILDRFYRAYGTFEQPNPFGGFMNLTSLLVVGTVLGAVVHVWLKRKYLKQGIPFLHKLDMPWFAVILLAVCAGVMVMAMLLSWSRGAWLSFGAGTAVLAFFWPRKRRYGIMVVATAIVGFVLLLQINLVPASVLDRLVSFSQDLQLGDVRGADINDANYAVLERLAHWQAAQDMARDNIWFGVGFGNYEPAYATYALINWPDPLGHAHNYYLNLLAEVGVFGLLAYLLLWTAVFWQTIRALNQESWILRGMVLGLLACWVGLSVHHLIDKLYVNNIYVHLGVMFGLLQLLDQQRIRAKHLT